MEIIQNEKLSKHSTFLIGGPADHFCKCQSPEDLKEAIQFAKQQEAPYLIIGGGSNILFDDEGFRGVIIKMEDQNVTFGESTVKAGAGTNVATLIAKTIQNGFIGLGKWVGLPGTIGGAVRGNAGCNGLETKDILVKATLFDPKTEEIKEVTAEYFQYGYRTSFIKSSDEIVLNATLQLQKSDESPEEQVKLMQEIRMFRKDAQPFGSSGGSFFKNPSPEKPAGMLIDQAGLKGKSIGNAQISEKHANFFLNKGGATSADIIELAKLAKEQVEAKTGIVLREEIQIIGKTGRTTI